VIGLLHEDEVESAERLLVSVQDRARLVDRLLPVLAARIRKVIGDSKLEELERNAVIRSTSIDYLRQVSYVTDASTGECRIEETCRLLRHIHTLALTSNVSETVRYCIADLDKIVSSLPFT